MKHIDKITIQLHVNDVGQSAKFYTEILGFGITDSWQKEGLDENDLPPGFWTTMIYHQANENLIFHMTLQENKEKSEADLGGKIVFELETDDLRGIFEKISQNNVKIIHSIKTQKYKAGDSPETVKEYKYDYFTIEDPDGYRWNLKTEDQMVG